MTRLNDKTDMSEVLNFLAERGLTLQEQVLYALVPARRYPHHPVADEEENTQEENLGLGLETHFGAQKDLIDNIFSPFAEKQSSVEEMIKSSSVSHKKYAKALPRYKYRNRRNDIYGYPFKIFHPKKYYTIISLIIAVLIVVVVLFLMTRYGLL